MTIRPCPDALDCPPDQPLDNFSSEGDDTLDFISTQYGYINPQDRLWDKTLCNVTFVSTISQADADQQATADALNCQPCPACTFSNTAQTVCVVCPDGNSQSCYTVAAGLFSGFLNQESADSAAHNFALTQVQTNVFCMSSIEACGCVGGPYSSQMTTSVPCIWTLDGGSMPPGILLAAPAGFSTSATITGIPVATGEFTFRIRAAAQNGTVSLRTYTISVIQITTTQLPSFSVGVPYSFQLQATGGSGNYLWRIVSGSLPNGLTLSNTGLISGIPT